MSEREAIVDAWGNEGEEETCMSCDGAGMLAKRYARAISAIVRELDRRGVPLAEARD